MDQFEDFPDGLYCQYLSSNFEDDMELVAIANSATQLPDVPLDGFDFTNLDSMDHSQQYNIPTNNPRVESANAMPDFEMPDLTWIHAHTYLI